MVLSIKVIIFTFTHVSSLLQTKVACSIREVLPTKEDSYSLHSLLYYLLNKSVGLHEHQKHVNATITFRKLT